MLKRKNGFTLVELLVVVAILGVLAAIGIVSFGGYLTSSKKTTLNANHVNVCKFIESTVMRCNLDSSYENEYVSSEFGAKSTFRCSQAVNNSGQYVTYAQQYFEGLGLKNTITGDGWLVSKANSASEYSSWSSKSPADLLGIVYALIDVVNDTEPFDIKVQTQWGNNAEDFHICEIKVKL